MARNKLQPDGAIVGSIVRVTAGRDKSRLMLVSGIENGRYLLCGGSRSTTNPKRKNPVHVQTVIMCAAANPEELTDQQIGELLEEAARSVS